MSGMMPSLLTSLPAGVDQLAKLSTRTAPSERPKYPWATPLPYVFVPTIVARQLSRSAPASTSDELADALSTHTCIGRLVMTISPCVEITTSSLFLSLTLITAGFFMKNPAALSAGSSKPPLLSRRSSTYRDAPDASRVLKASRKRSSAWLENKDNLTYPNLPDPSFGSYILYSRGLSSTRKLLVSTTLRSFSAGPLAALTVIVRVSLSSLSRSFIWKASSPRVGWPLIVVRTSPFFKPFLAASVPSSGIAPTTTSPFSAMIGIRPTPVTSSLAKLDVICFCVASSGGRGGYSLVYLSPSDSISWAAL
mmetsp:Transcript_107415/g.206584  ORF Transcript_107415/g.206584 Transcript_107415/m.206584 type:complete len:308 (-) Transcript_107415:713-1636(-)